MTRRAFGRSAGLALAAIPLAAPAIASAQDATPAAAPGAGSLATMLALAPAAHPWVEDPASLTISFADIAAQLAATGVPPADTMDDPGFRQWAAATRSLTLPADAVQYLAFWREDYGFDLLQADQTLWLSLPPLSLALYRGRFDHEAIRSTLVAKGYREVEVDGHALLTLRDDFEVDPTGPFAYKLAAMNHVALLEDGTVACSSVRAALATVLDVAAGQAPALLDQAGIALVAGQAPAGLVSGLIAGGTMLAGSLPPALVDLAPDATPDLDAIATAIAGTSEMSPVVTVLVGATAGGPLLGQGVETPAGVPDAHAVAVALLLTPELAAAAVPVVEERLATGESQQTGQPYSEVFAAADVVAVPGMPVLRVDLTLAPERSPTILVNMLLRRDLGFLAW